MRAVSALVLVLAIMTLLSCKPKYKQHAEEIPRETKVSEVPLLTDAQKNEGWKLLFDGRSYDGWHYYQNQPHDSWEIVNGALHCKPFADGKENKRADLITNEEFENFELTWDWKIAAQGNSGVMYRATEQLPHPYQSGPEYQMLDDIGYPGKKEDWQLSGGVFGLYAPKNAKPNPAGEWNSSKIVIDHGKVEHWLNGVKVLSYDFNSNDWKKKKAGTKWNETKEYGQTAKAHIDLQDHFTEAWFKNILIRPL